ncbi:MAG: ORF6N domain-containing protein [Eubacteriales bacterium]|nr:ORF6N domain-containing protein [Eubacteriales bacterium]
MPEGKITIQGEAVQEFTEKDNKEIAEKEVAVTDIAIVDECILRDKIYEIRGMKVMLDFELAEIYGYETKNFNRQVKNNAAKFEGDDFMFQLTRSEIEELSRCNNFTSIQTKGVKGGRTNLPYAFTEQGVYMLMTVLRGELATRQSRALVRAFKSLKDYIIENQGLIGRQEYLRLSMQVSDNIREGMQMRRDLDELTEDMKGVLDRLSDVVTKSEIAPILLELGEPEDKREYLFLDGQPMKAVDAYIKIYSKAKKTIHIVDDYIGPKTLHLLQGAQNGVSITLISDNRGGYLKASDYSDFQKEFPGNPVTFLQSKGKSHDRFIVLDYGTAYEKAFHCGTSSKDAGNRATAITEFSDSTVKVALSNLLGSMISNPILVLK